MCSFGTVSQSEDQKFWADRQKSGFEVATKPQPEGKLAGPKKPAILRTLDESREYCRVKYPGGDLPTNKQWEKACGDKEYCTVSGKLKHTEARFAHRS